MKKLYLGIFIIIIAVTNGISQYVPISTTFTNADDLGLDIPVNVVSVGKNTVVVPPGKIWFTKEYRNITVDFSKETQNAPSKCNSGFESSPRLLFGLNVTPPYGKTTKYGIIFKDYNKTGGYNSASFRFVPSAFVKSNFNRSFLKVMVPRMMGRPELEFLPGTSLYVDDCIERIELYEINMATHQYYAYAARMERKRLEWVAYQQQIEKQKIEKYERELQAKIDKGHEFAIEDLDVKPKYVLDPENLLLLFKDVYFNDFKVELIVNADGSLDFVKSDKYRINPRLLKEFIQFSPGAMIIQDKPISVKTRIELVFTSDYTKELKNRERVFKFRKKRKDPYIKIKEYPDIYPETELRKIVNLRKELKHEAIGTYFLKINVYKIKANVYINANIKDKQLINKEFEKIRWYYKKRDGGWKYKF